MAATTSALTAVLTADCSRATSRLPFGSRVVAFRSRSAGSAVPERGRTTLAEVPELLLTKTSEDFLRASPSLRAGTGGGVWAGAGARVLTTTGAGCGAG